MNTTPWRVARLAGLLAGGLLACTTVPAADSARAALSTAMDCWMTAVNAQDVTALKSTMTEDVELLEGSARVTGRDAVIRAVLDVPRGRLVATTLETTIASDVAWRVAGLAQIQKNGDVLARGHALEIWKRVNGQWRLHRRMVTGAATAGDLLTRPSTNEPVLDRSRN